MQIATNGRSKHQEAIIDYLLNTSLHYEYLGVSIYLKENA